MNCRSGNANGGFSGSQGRIFGMLLALLIAAPQASAVQPPRYLAIPAFEKCLAEQQNGTFQTWCMPATKPQACPQASWRELRQLKGGDRLPSCHERRGQR